MVLFLLECESTRESVIAVSSPRPVRGYMGRRDGHDGDLPMRRNLSAEDRLFRLVVGLTLLPLAVVLDGDARLIGLLSAIPLLQSLFGWSPMYALIGISTRVDLGDDESADTDGGLIPVPTTAARR